MTALLEGRVAIVTGSGQGIGRDIALCLARNGAAVVTNNRKPGSSLDAFEKTTIDFSDAEREALEAMKGDAKTTADRIEAEGGRAAAFFGDVSDFATAAEIVEAAVETYGRIDIIVHNASSNWVGNIADMDEDTWTTSIQSKLGAAFALMHHALPHMKRQGYGRLLNSSSDAYLGIEGYAAYGAANAGVVALSRSAAKDLAGTGITVNAYTPLARTRSWFNAAAKYRLQGVPPEALEAGAPAAMKRTAEGMVPFLAFLASEHGADISGQLFKLAADGTIGLWSSPEVVREITTTEDVWSIDDLITRIPGELLAGLEADASILPMR